MRLYFIAILTSDEINKDVRGFKEFMQQEFGCKAALKSPAHITLVPPFLMEEASEHELINTLNDFTRSSKPFKLHLHDFSAFPPRVIYVAIEESKRLRDVHAELQEHLLNQQKFAIKHETRKFNAHVTIATRDLQKADFKKAWSIFESKSYDADFIAEGIALLRNTPGRWDVIHIGPFHNDP